MPLLVRSAHSGDWPTLVEFNCCLAQETEGLSLARETITAGVQALLADPSRGRYLVACAGEPEKIVGQLMHTREWSDWRNGDIWWLQSVYVAAEWRRRGVFRALFEHLAAEAASDPGVVGLRLYVENHNDAAREVYHRLGLRNAGYQVLERLHAVENSHRLR